MLKNSLRTLFCIIVLPLLAWSTARLFVPHPLLVAPFLFVSPIIAIFIGGSIAKIFMVRRMTDPSIYEPKPPDFEMKALAAKIAEISGLTSYRIERMTYETRSGFDPVKASDERIVVQSSGWRPLDTEEKEFAMARAFAQLETARGNGPWGSVASFAGIFVSCCLGMVNLWLILPCQASFAVVFFLITFGRQMKEISEADVKALGWTRKLEPAITYLKACAPEHSWAGPGRKQRIANVRQKAEELGLGA